MSLGEPNTADAFYPKNGGLREYLKAARPAGNIWVNSIGYWYFGRKSTGDHDTWVTTRWFVVFGWPVWPMETVKIGNPWLV